ncbi:MAG: hypothetical protein V4645_14190 [Pseudomonadota bacterium]
MTGISSAHHAIPDIVSSAQLLPRAVAVDSGEIKITFINYSKYEFRRDVTGYTKDFALGSITSSPGTVLKAHSGMESLDICQIAFSWIAEGANNAYVTWYSPEIPVRFGARIVAPVQVFGMGPRPHWEVCWDNNPGADPHWAKSGSEPSDPRVFFADGHIAGLTATGRARSWHTALDLTVTISNYTPGKP